MKTFLAGLFALLVALAAAGAAWWYFHHRPLPASAAAYLPPDTLLYAEIPDGARTALRFQTSQLKRLLDNGETQGVLALLASRLSPARPGADAEAAEHLRAAGEEAVQALGGQSFLALTRFDWDAGKNPGFPAALRDAGLLVGFHQSPGKGGHVEALWRELLAAWRSAPGETTPGNAVHGAVPYTYLELNGTGVRICRARWKEWNLISLGEAPLADFLDRAAGAAGPSLKTAPDYAAVIGKLDPASDLLGYIDYRRGLNAYRKVLASAVPGAGFAPDGGALDAVFRQIGFMHAAGFSMAFQKGGEIVDRCVVAAPAAERGEMTAHFSPVALASARFTTPSTVLYTAQNLDPEAYYNQQVAVLQGARDAAAKDGTPPPPSPYEAAEAQLKAQGLDLHENVLRALGPELGFVVDWPEGQEFPDVLLAWAIRDREKFTPAYAKLVQFLSAALPMVGTVDTLSVGAYQGLSLAPKQFPFLSPTVFAGPDFFGLSLTGAGARRLLAEGHPQLAPENVNGPALPGHTGKPYAVAYLDAAALVGRGYAAGKPFLPKYLATLAPGADFGKLPAASQAAPLLGALRFVAWSDGDFLRSDAVSPEGTGFLAALVVGGVAGPLLHPAPPAPTPAAEALPAAAPAP